MSLSNIKKSEFDQWEIVSGEYKGVDFYVTLNRYGLYTAVMNIMFAEDGEHDGHVSVDSVSEGSIAELKQSIKESINYFIEKYGNPNAIAKKCREIDFGAGTIEDFYKKVK